MSVPFEPDCEPGAPHPRATYGFFGHDAAERMLADALAGDRMHHAWLICGPKGVGKATLAYRFARIALGASHSGPRPLDVPSNDAIAHRIEAQTHPDLFVLRRGLNDRGRPRSEISIDEARTLGAFFSLKATEGGWRVAIIDSADDLNRNAANAILKTLEEPPRRAVLLLLSHSPGGLLPTIRSRCRRLLLRPLDDEAVRAVAGKDADAHAVRFAAGQPGRAVALAAANVGEAYAGLTRALERSRKAGPAAFMGEAFKSGDRMQRLALFLELARDWSCRAVRAAAGTAPAHPDDAALMAQLAPPERLTRWAESHDALVAIAREADGLDMDPTHAFARAAAVLARAAA